MISKKPKSKKVNVVITKPLPSKPILKRVVIGSQTPSEDITYEQFCDWVTTPEGEEMMQQLNDQESIKEEWSRLNTQWMINNSQKEKSDEDS